VLFLISFYNILFGKRKNHHLSAESFCHGYSSLGHNIGLAKFDGKSFAYYMATTIRGVFDIWILCFNDIRN
jgi:hypothetical protein